MSKLATIGIYDAIHLGHIEIIKKLLRISELESLKPKIYIFRETYKREGNIYTLEDRINILNKLGINDVEILDFEHLKNVNYMDFIYRLKNDDVTKLVVGKDFTFGKNREGNVSKLIEMHNSNIIKIEIVEDIINDNINKKISTNDIYNFIRKGKISEANSLLITPFSITGIVNKGYSRGKSIGFPTANISYPENLIKLPDGVYASQTLIDNKIYNSMTSIGIPKMLGDAVYSVETNIFDFNQNIYGKKIKIYILKKIRDNKKFDTKEEFINQLMIDKLNSIEIQYNYSQNSNIML